MTHRKKQIYLLLGIAVIAVVVIFVYPIGNKALADLRNHSYLYSYTPPKNMAILDTSNLPPAQAVPIIMYHGIIADNITDPEKIGTNTTRKDFISQMEMLKENGYETISISEYDLWTQGKFTLPPKPIIITFDDARKDSYYTVDEVLTKLGFKATNFVVTARTLENDPFFLSWDELKQMQASGHWELEAHGRNSHDKFVEDAQGDLGNFLTALKYSPTGTESVADYKARVEADYVNGIKDLKENLGIDAKYYAVPMDHYGVSGEINYPEAESYNQELTQKYFKFAFVEASAENNQVFESFYNYKDTKPIELKRLEVKGMSTSQLLDALNHFAPGVRSLVYPSKDAGFSLAKNSYVLYGDFSDNGTEASLSSSTAIPSSRILFGNSGWKNYSMKIDVTRNKGRSASVFVYYVNEDNYIGLDWDQNSVRLAQVINGKDTELGWVYPLPDTNDAKINIRIYNGIIDATFNGILLAKDKSIDLLHGSAGFGVWDLKGAQSTIKSIDFEPLNSTPLAIDYTVDPAAETNPVESETPEKPTNSLFPYSSDGFLNSELWKSIWGDFTIKSGNLNILGIPDTTNNSTKGAVLLNGSASWKYYILKTKVYWTNNGNLTLFSRYQDNNNYIGCTYSNYGGNVTLFSVVDGKMTTLAENKGLPMTSFNPWSFSMKVQQDHFECQVGDTSVVTADNSAIPQTGSVGIGFDTGDKLNDNTLLRIDEIQVVPAF